MMSSSRVAVRCRLGDDVVHARAAPQAEEHDAARLQTHLLELDLLLLVVVERDGVRTALAAAPTFNGLHEEVVAAACFDALEERAVVVARNPFGHDAADLETFAGCFLALPSLIFLLAHAAAAYSER